MCCVEHLVSNFQVYIFVRLATCIVLLLLLLPRYACLISRCCWQAALESGRMQHVSVAGFLDLAGSTWCDLSIGLGQNPDRTWQSMCVRCCACLQKLLEACCSQQLSCTVWNAHVCTHTGWMQLRLLEHCLEVDTACCWM